MAKLTDKQEMFCKEYIIDLNATQAAIRAGYALNESPPKSGFYVYALICGMTNKVIYIGKGKGGRVFHHVKNRNNKQVNNQKNEAIIECMNAGFKINHMIMTCIKREDHAYSNESEVIERIGIDNLTNVSEFSRSKKGSDFGPLGSPSEFDSFSSWAKNALSIIKLNKGMITFMGKKIDEEERLIPFLERIANE